MINRVFVLHARYHLFIYYWIVHEVQDRKTEKMGMCNGIEVQVLSLALATYALCSYYLCLRRKFDQEIGAE